MTGNCGNGAKGPGRLSALPVNKESDPLGKGFGCCPLDIDFWQANNAENKIITVIPDIVR